MLFTLQEVSIAQSKPKRDVSKDKSGIVAIPKQVNKRTIQRNRKSKPTKNQRKRESELVEQKATFLTVDKQISVSRTLYTSGGNASFNVDTDGKEWIVTDLPSWCHVTNKYYSWFSVAYDANTTHEDRQGWFDVKSDNQSVRVYVLQQGTPLNVQARFSNVFLQHNVLFSYGSSLKINANVTISGAAEQELWVGAYIIDDDDTKIKAKKGYEDYALPNSNNIFVKAIVSPRSDNPETFNVVLHIPNNSMSLVKRKNNLECKLVVYNTKAVEYVNGATYTIKFNAKSKKGFVTTQ